jgi:hypothetical protein
MAYAESEKEATMPINTQNEQSKKSVLSAAIKILLLAWFFKTFILLNNGLNFAFALSNMLI